MTLPVNEPDKVLLPILPLRDVVVFPHMVIPLFVGRPKSIKALESAMESGKTILLVAQKFAAKDEPAPEDLYKVCSVGNLLQMLKLGKLILITLVLFSTPVTRVFRSLMEGSWNLKLP